MAGGGGGGGGWGLHRHRSWRRAVWPDQDMRTRASSRGSATRRGSGNLIGSRPWPAETPSSVRLVSNWSHPIGDGRMSQWNLVCTLGCINAKFTGKSWPDWIEWLGFGVIQKVIPSPGNGNAVYLLFLWLFINIRC